MAEEVGVAFVRLVPSMQGFADDAANAMNRVATGPAGNAGDAAGQSFGTKFGAAFKAGLAGVAVGAGVALLAGLTEALDQGTITARLGAQLGATAEDAERYGDIAGSLYADAVTEDFQGAADTIQAVMRAGLLPTDATDAQIESLSTSLADVSSLMGEDVGQTARAVGKMIKTGLADTATEALDLLTRGVQTGANEAEDLLDTFSEYSTQFRSMGLSGEQAMGLISQGLKGGARDADVVADTIKEFSIEAVQGGERVRGGFETLGLDADRMVDKFAKGGPTAARAFDTVLDKLRGIKDPAERNAAAVELFGTKAEDMAGALEHMDLSSATDQLGKVRGAADEAGDALRDSAGVKLEQFKRRMTQGLVDFLGDTVIPGVTEAAADLKGLFGDLWTEAGKGSEGAADQAAEFVKLLGIRIGEQIREMAPHAIDALLGFGQAVADYVVANPRKVLKIALIAGALAAVIPALPLLLAGALAAAAGTMVVGFVKQLGDKLTENLPKWWGAFKGWVEEKAAAAPGMFGRLGRAIGGWFSGLWSRYISGPVSRAWRSFIDGVKGLPGRAVRGLGSLGGSLAGVASRAWQRFRDAAAAKVRAFIDWVKKLPQRAKDALGDLRETLVEKGKDLVRGLWNGITSMGDWLKDKITGWTDTIIGPFKAGLEIFSPSRVMRDEVGRQIPAGLALGIRAGLPSVEDASLAMAGAARMPAAAGSYATGPGSAAAPAPVLRMVGDGSRASRVLMELMQDSVRLDYGGDPVAALRPPR